MKEKIALFCDVDVKAVITARDVEERLRSARWSSPREGVDEIVLRITCASTRRRAISPAGAKCWTAWTTRAAKCRSAIVGKYVEYEDSYKSLKEALLHGGLAHQLKVNIHWIEAEGIVGEGWERQLEAFDGILVPGGFGKRGIDGMLNAIRYARENKVPYFGICLGMQTLVIEYARNVCGLERRGLHRVQSRHAASRHLQTARVERRG